MFCGDTRIAEVWNVGRDDTAADARWGSFLQANQQGPEIGDKRPQRASSGPMHNGANLLNNLLHHSNHNVHSNLNNILNATQAAGIPGLSRSPQSEPNRGLNRAAKPYSPVKSSATPFSADNAESQALQNLQATYAAYLAAGGTEGMLRFLEQLGLAQSEALAEGQLSYLQNGMKNKFLGLPVRADGEYTDPSEDLSEDQNLNAALWGPNVRRTGTRVGKRSIDKGKYKTQMCAHWKMMQFCPFADRCAFAHGAEELRPSEMQIFMQS